MTGEIEPYVSFHGLELALLVDEEGVGEDGGERQIDDFSGPGRDYAEIREQGMGRTTYSFDAWSDVRADIEALVAEVLTAPIDAEICPREADRCNYVVAASASRPKITPHYMGGIKVNQYHCQVSAVCRNGQLLGDEQGIELVSDPALPQTSSLTNDGYYPAPLDYLYLSGKYDATLGLSRDLRLQMGDYDIQLCSCLMGRDKFKLDRYGQIIHSKETNFSENYATLQAEMMGDTFCDYGTSGSMAYESFVMGNSASLMFPFFGPLPIREPPYLEVVISHLVGNPIVYKSITSDLSIVDEVEFTLKVGINKVYIPACEGEGFVSFGIMTDTSSSCTIDRIYGEVNRYISPESIPIAETGKTFDITVSDGEFSNHMLSAMQLVYRNVY